MTGSGNLPYIYNFNKPGTKVAIPTVDTATHGVETLKPTGSSLIGGVRGDSAIRGG